MVSNVRGTSKEVIKNVVSKTKISDFVLSHHQSFRDKDKNYYILSLNSV